MGIVFKLSSIKGGEKVRVREWLKVVLGRGIFSL